MSKTTGRDVPSKMPKAKLLVMDENEFTTFDDQTSTGSFDSPMTREFPIQQALDSDSDDGF